MIGMKQRRKIKISVAVNRKIKKKRLVAVIILLKFTLSMSVTDYNKAFINNLKRLGLQIANKNTQEEVRTK